MDVGQSEVAPCITVSQLGVVESHQPEHRRMQIVDMDPILNRFETEIVGRTISLATPDPTPCEPDAKAVVVVVPAADGPFVGTLLRQLDRRCSSEFATPKDKRLVE